MSYKISVIIPVYNAENDLKNAVNSIMGQTFEFNNIELILVDDVSTDNSRKIIKNYESNYPNIKGVYLDNNLGLPGRPRNIGIQYATSDYVSFLDADDIYLPNAFELMYNAMMSENPDFVIGTYNLNLDGDRVKINILPTEEKIVNFNPFENQETFDKLSINQFVSPLGKLFKREFILKHNIIFSEDTLCEDTYFYFKYLINSKKVTVLPNSPLFEYNTFEDKTTAIHGHDLKKFYNFLNGTKKTYNDILKNIKFSKNIFLSENISSILLIFSNSNKKNKKQAIMDLYDFEKDIDVKITRPEIAFLNSLIKSKHFALAITVSNFYSFLYTNKVIKKLYRKFNNAR